MTILEAMKQLRDDLKTWCTNNFVNLNNKIDSIAGDSVAEELAELKKSIGIQSDWDEVDETSPAYILNKPTELGGYAYMYFDGSGLARIYSHDDTEIPGTYMTRSAFESDYYKRPIMLVLRESDYLGRKHAVPLLNYVIDATGQFLITYYDWISGNNCLTSTYVQFREGTNMEEPSTDIGTEEPTDIGTEEPTDIGTDESTEIGTDESTEIGTDESTEVSSD